MFKYILQRFILDILYFPLWWYTRGFTRTIKFALRSVADAERQIALGIWLKAMFKPMFQDYTWEGRMVSFFMRIMLLIFKIVMFGAWVIGAILIIIAWTAIPIIAVWLLWLAFRI